MKASYINNPSVSRRGSSSLAVIKRVFGALLLALVAVPALAGLVVSFSSSGSETSTSTSLRAFDEEGNTITAEASFISDLPRMFMCNIAPDAGAAVSAVNPSAGAIMTYGPEIYQWIYTDDIPFYTQSKSAIVSQHNEVDTYFPNRILNMGAGPSFGEVNDWVVGSVDPYNEEYVEYEEYDGTVGVSPYDRFGLAGLQWSSYGGEWKYYALDACSPDESSDPGLNVFYDDRLEPRATYEEVSNSEDKRVQQFNVGWFEKISYAFSNTVSNHIFAVAKFIVALTVSLVSFAFSDVVGLLGFDTMILGEDLTGTTGGIFNMLYNSLFTPLVILMFLATIVYMMYQGFIKRKYREALVSGLLRSVLCFVAAIIIFSFPATSVKLPNDIAVTTQAVLLSGYTQGDAGGDGLCNTSIHQAANQMPDGSDVDASDQGEAISFIDEVSMQISSSLGCTMWNTLLFSPWAQGQFGADWEQLYAESWDGEDFNPRPNDTDTGTLGNDNDANGSNPPNASWVGNAGVAIGNNEFINNWALFQLSTQTDSHYDVELEEISPNYTAGVSNDWWRVVDAMSNYNHEVVPLDLDDDDQMQTEGSDGAFGEAFDVDAGSAELGEAEIVDIDNADPTEYWNSWIGNNRAERLQMAATSTLFSGLTAIPLLVLSFMSVMYSLGLAILMSFAPIMFLLGIWAGPGWQVFMGWLQLVLNTIMKRIGVGVLMVVAISISIAALNLIDDIGYFQAIIAMIIMTFLLVKSKDKLLEMMAFIRFSSADQGISNVGSKIGKAGTFVTGAAGKATAATAYGAYRGGSKGSGFMDSITNAASGAASAGFMSTRNSAYRASSGSPMIRNIQGEYNTTMQKNTGEFHNDVFGTSEIVYCAGCGRELSPNEPRAIASNDFIYCQTCYDQEHFRNEDDSKANMRLISARELAEAKSKRERKAEEQQEVSQEANRKKAEKEEKRREKKEKEREKMTPEQRAVAEKKDREKEREKERRENASTATPKASRRISVKNTETAKSRLVRDIDTGEDKFADPEELQGVEKRIAELIEQYNLDHSESKEDQDFIVSVIGVEGAMHDVAEIVGEHKRGDGEYGEEYDASGVNLIDLPDEIKNEVNMDMIQRRLAQRDYEGVVHEISEAWVKWYEQQGDKNADYETGYSYDRVSDMRSIMYNRQAILSRVIDKQEEEEQ